ncbi:MAG: aspartate aminotransferase family protein [Phycisphaerales bacterium]|nr:aspartate aminotransferase family protein [Phycisphaerales bacterium]
MTDSLRTLAARADALELGVYSRLPILPVRGQGCRLYDAEGNSYLDMYGGHAVASTGHCHPHVVEAIRRQAGELLFYSNSIHFAPRVDASELLLKHAPHADSRVFYISTGCEANEVAIKSARKITGRRKIVAFQGAFHGRTLAALSASGVEKYRKTLGPSVAPDIVHVPFDDIAAAEAAIDGDTAAVITETIQSLGGVNVAQPEFYQALRRATERVGAALIFDEVQTGFGRTGKYFFGEHVGVKADILTLAKGIASGVPCGAVIFAPKWAAEIKPNDQGTTFGGGPLAMAAMLATLQVIENENLTENAARVGEMLREQCAKLPGVVRVRGMGLLLGLEFAGPAKPVQDGLLARRVLVGGCDQLNVIRLLPPLTLSQAEAQGFVDALKAVLST